MNERLATGAVVALAFLAAACTKDAVVAPTASALPQAGPVALPPGLLAPGPRKSLVLVTLDTTRSDRLGCYGYAPACTPCLDALAGAGVAWEQAWAAAPITLASHASILSGVYPCAHGVRENGAFVAGPKAQLLSKVLQSAGFRTGASIGSFILDSKFGLAQGFDRYFEPDASRVGVTWKVTERSAAVVTDDALAFLDEVRAGERFFLWVHYYDPHHPYEPPAGFTPPGGDAYDGEIAFCDTQLRRLLARIAERRLDEGLLVAVTADHGESLGEHGESSHGIFAYDATLRVPLIVAPPLAGGAAGRRVRAPVSNVDLAATLLDALGVGRAALPDARTPPLPVAEADDADERALYVESMTPYYAHRWHPLRGVVWKGFKYLDAPRAELYSLRDDPGEKSDLLAQEPALAERMRKRLDGLVAENAPLGWGDEGVVSIADADGIQKLGYAQAVPGGDPFAPGLPDPKERIGDLELFDRSIGLTREGTAVAATNPGVARKMLLEAKGLLETMQQRFAGDPSVRTQLANVLMGLEQWADAAKPLEEAIVDNPDNAGLHYNLGVVYSRLGRKSWAVREVEKTHHLDPRGVAAVRWLVDAMMKERDWPGAAWWLDAQVAMAGQSDAEVANAKSMRAQVEKQLRALNARPREPKAVALDELLPEGVRARQAEALREKRGAK